jgi:hemerythrin-like domain-containing protein
MPRTETANIGRDLIRIHLVITRGLGVAREACGQFRDAGFPDDSVKAGFLSYFRTLLSVMHAHHLVEDQVDFPVLKRRLPEAPFDLLLLQHREIAAVLAGMAPALDDIEAGEPPSIPLAELERALDRLFGIWHPHIRLEETYLSPEAVDRVLSPDDHARLAALSGEQSRRYAGPDALVVPFLLYNLPEDERRELSRAMPPAITAELVPVVWRERWAPMKPFLLEE